jgi:hypothetical protein
MAWGDLVGTRATLDGASSNDATSHTFTLGQTGTAENLLISLVNWDKTPEAGAGTPTCRDAAASGDFWTVVFIEASDSTAASAIAWKISDGDETQCHWAWTTSEQMIGEVGEYEGPWVASPVDKTVTYENATVRDDIPFPAPGVLSQADEMFFAIGGWDTVDVGITYTWDNSFTEIAEYRATGTGNGMNGASTAKRIVSSTADIGVTTLSQDTSDVDAVAGVLMSFKKGVGPDVTDVDTDEEIYDGQLNVTITGTDFGGTTGKVYISETATLGAVGTYTQLAVDSWADTSIQVDIEEITTGNPVSDDVPLFTKPYIIVEDSSVVRSAGFQVTLTSEPHLALNTDGSIDVDVTHIIVARAQNSGGLGGTSFRWSVNHNSGGYVPLTTTSSNVKAVATDAFLNDADIGEILTGTGSYIDNNNAGSEDGTFSLAAAMGASTAFNAALAFQIVGADVSNGQTGIIRLEEGDGTDFGTYTQTFQYTVVEGGGPAANPHEPLGHPLMGPFGGPI